MAKKITNPKKKISRTRGVEKMLDVMESPVAETSAKPRFGFVFKVMLVVAIGVALFMLARKYRGLVIAGVVNKTPILRYELNQTLAKRYGKVVLDEIINNNLIKQEATKLKISVNDNDLKEEIKKLEDKIGGEQALNDAMAQYGLSRSELEDQIRVSVLQRKIAEQRGNNDVTEEEIKAYFTENGTFYKGKQLSDVKGEIAGLLKEQKMQEEFSRWFSEVKAKAQIQSYLD